MIKKVHREILDEWFVTDDLDYIVIKTYQDKNDDRFAGYIIASYDQEYKITQISNVYIMFNFFVEKYEISVDNQIEIPRSVNLTNRDTSFLIRLFEADRDFIKRREL